MNDSKGGRGEADRRIEVDARAPYEAPRIMKKRSVARVTLFSGTSAAGAAGVTSA
jgi:hypothetical protein